MGDKRNTLKIVIDVKKRQKNHPKNNETIMIPCEDNLCICKAHNNYQELTLEEKYGVQLEYLYNEERTLNILNKYGKGIVEKYTKILQGLHEYIIQKRRT